MNIVQEILKRHIAGDNELNAGEYILADLDFIYTNGLTLASAIKEIDKLQIDELWDNTKVAVFPDHFTPNKDILTANLKKQVRTWVEKKEITNYFEVGDVGIEHIQFIEQQFVPPGSLVIGGDSHTCTLGAIGILSLGVGTTDLAFGLITGKVWLKMPKIINIKLTGTLQSSSISGKDIILYILNKVDPRALNYNVVVFTGEGCKELNFNDRLTMCNMGVEGGAKTAMFYPSDIDLNKINYKNVDEDILQSMSDSTDFDQEIQIQLEAIDHQVAVPHSPQNAKSLSVVKQQKVSLDQVFIGSCTNGSIEDLRIAAKILKGKRRNKRTRLIIIPATPHIFQQAEQEGLVKVFLDAGAVIGPPTCGPCLGGHMGVIGDGEVCLATTNRNFKGRMGSTLSKVYLSSPFIAAHSAIAGYITDSEVV